MKTKIYAALRTDLHEGCVWTNSPPSSRRTTVKIINIGARKKVYCECLGFDKNFINEYNKPGANRKSIPESNEVECVIVMSQWYRQKLGIGATGEEHNLVLAKAETLYGGFFASIDHPQIVVRVAAKLGAIGVVLGLVGVVLGCVSLSGCGPSKAEQTLSSLNVAADGWDGKPDFVVAGNDAYGRPLASRIEKGPVNYVLEIRSYGPDGLPSNSDDIVVTRRHRHGESSLAIEAGKATGEVAKGAASGAIQGLKQGIGLGKRKADKPEKDDDNDEDKD